jgi:hypothetical protein
MPLQQATDASDAGGRAGGEPEGGLRGGCTGNEQFGGFADANRGHRRTADLQHDLGGAIMQSIFGALLAPAMPPRRAA